MPPEIGRAPGERPSAIPMLEVIDPQDLLGVGAGSDLLVADDDAGTLTAYEAALAPLGRNLVLVRSGADALARLAEQDFALLVLDVTMPGISGLETARRLRRLGRNRGLPILFITGATASTDLVLEAYAAGGYDFVTKPVLPEVLRAKVRVYLRLQERTHALQRESAQLRDAHQRLDRAHQQLRAQTDATDAARRQQGLHEAAGRRKDEFLAVLSHELRNPLWAVVSALELIKARDPSRDRELAIVERHVERLAHIVGDLLDVSRITRGRIELRRGPVAVDAAVDAALEAARPMIEARDHQVAVRVAGDLVVDADHHRLRQVLENLIGNAAQYTAERGRIEISAEPDGGFVEIAVRDNGRGIAEPLLSTLFEPFVQGEPVPDRGDGGDGGLGIGLTFAARLAELHGGAIAARSDGPGTGATFTLRWPAAVAAPPAAAPPATARSPAATGRRILIVDDNTDAAEMLGELLRSSGHAIAVAPDAATALTIAGEFAPQIALLDIGLPVVDGYELARRLRALPACRTTMLIAITGYGQASDRSRSFAAGFAHHLVKPANLATLEALLAAAPAPAPADHEA